MLHGLRYYRSIAIMLITAVTLPLLFSCTVSSTSVDVDKFTTGTPPQTITFTEPNNLINSEHGITLLSKMDVEKFELIVEGKESNGSYPSGLTLDILGGGNSPDWSFPGELKGEVSIYGTRDDALTSALTEAKRNYTNVIFEFTSRATGILVLKSIEVNFQKPSANIPPVIRSASPENSLISINTAASETFSVNAFNDDPAELAYKWFLSGEEVGTGKTYIFESNVQGVKSLVLRISDGMGYISYGWIIVVEFENIPPEANITYPRPIVKGLKYRTDVPIPFSAESSLDPDSNITYYRWISSIDGEISNSAAYDVTLSPGSHVITLMVIDEQGAVGTDLINITVLGSATDNTEETGLGWILFFIVLGLFVLTVSVMFIIIARKNQRSVSPRIEKEENRIPPRISRKRISSMEDEYDEGINAKTPSVISREITVDDTVKCEVCNKSFTKDDNAYICSCDSLFHLDCVISDCPSCGADTGISLGSVNISGRKRDFKGRRAGKGGSGESGWFTVKNGVRGDPAGEIEFKRKKRNQGKKSGSSLNDGSVISDKWVDVSSIRKANICTYCRKMLKKGTPSKKCPHCGKFMHKPCSVGLDKCPNCGEL